MMFLVLASAFQIIQKKTILWPKGWTALALWCVLMGVLVPEAEALNVSLLFYCLLLNTVVGVFAIVQLYGKSQYVAWLMKTYILSYLFTAMFGLVQFLTPGLHLGTYFVTQWIVHGKVPRINGFNYEPSYYVTYLIMGWIMMVDLRASRAEILSGRVWKWLTIATGASLFLSTSRTGWVMMLIEVMARLVPKIYHGLERGWDRLRRGDLRVPIPRARFLVLAPLILFLAGSGISQLGRLIDLNLFLSGTGINNTAAHSVNDRTRSTGDTKDLLLAQPFLGRGMSGVPEGIAKLHGDTVASMADVRLHWGFPVVLEVAAASGIFGLLPFLWFFTTNTIGEIALIRQNWMDERAKWLRALVRALIFEFLILLANQNLLRQYLWFHVAMVLVIGYNLRYVPRGFPGNAELATA